MRGERRVDAIVALCFVLAAIAEAWTRYRDSPGLLAFNGTGALWLAVLAVRRTRPVLAIGVIAGAGVFGTVLTVVVWPQTSDDAGVWIVAMMLAAYSLGAYARGRVVVLGVLLPLVVVVSADLVTRSGWSRISGILFVSVFIGLLPTAVGRLVGIRTERLALLEEQRERIVQEQRAQQRSAVVRERLRTAERLQPVLVEGLRALASSAERAADRADPADTGDLAADPGEIEASARTLLARTREEVVALTAPVEDSPVPDVPTPDHVAALRAAAQPWAVLAAGAVAVGLSLEAPRVLELNASGWLVVPAALVVAAPLALAWRWPLLAVAIAWLAAAAYSRLLAPLDGTLTEAGLAFAAAFAVGALCRRRVAIVGLAVCWLGQLVGVGTEDVLEEGAFLLFCWLGGLAVNEVSRLVEQTRANNDLLAGQEATVAARAVVEERLRLARDIHDALGHSLTVVALQAGAARRAAGADPEQAAATMRTVAMVARSGVAALAMDDGGDIGALVERVRSTGLAVDAELADVDLLDPVQQVVAFRLVQEGLTNVLRHAPGSRASVAVRRADEGVEVVVANTAPTGASSGAGTGRGLAGIRERVCAGAGQAMWGPREDGGFEVRALLPVPTLSPAAR